jgi:hypothetical protein
MHVKPHAFVECVCAVPGGGVGEEHRAQGAGRGRKDIAPSERQQAKAGEGGQQGVGSADSLPRLVNNAARKLSTIFFVMTSSLLVWEGALVAYLGAAS